MEPNFDPSVPRRAYGEIDWIAKEDWYVAEIAKIDLPTDVNPSHIKTAALMIDKLLSIALIDYAFIHQNAEKYSTILKIQEKDLFVDLKINKPIEYQGLKLTVDELKGAVTRTIRKTPYEGTGINLYDIVIMSGKRNIFMENVIKVLQNKKDLLITHLGINKLEGSIMNLTNSTIQNKQQ